MSESEQVGEETRQDTGARLLAGRYRLGEVLGRGGMGTVRRAEDEAVRLDDAGARAMLREVADGPAPGSGRAGHDTATTSRKLHPARHRPGARRGARYGAGSTAVRTPSGAAARWAGALGQGRARGGSSGNPPGPRVYEGQ